MWSVSILPAFTSQDLLLVPNLMVQPGSPRKIFKSAPMEQQTNEHWDGQQGASHKCTSRKCTSNKCTSHCIILRIFSFKLNAPGFQSLQVMSLFYFLGKFSLDPQSVLAAVWTSKLLQRPEVHFSQPKGAPE